jgi:hypothetical protein
MTIRRGAQRVLWYECIGFGMLIMLSWVGGAQHWAEYLFGGKLQAGNWRDSAMETVLILCIWGVVFGLTKKLVNHLHYLEGFIRVCAWCRKVGYEDNWVKLEHYFAEGFHIQTTHGMCPECLRQLEEDTRLRKRAEFSNQTAAAAAMLEPQADSSGTVEIGEQAGLNAHNQMTVAATRVSRG